MLREGRRPVAARRRPACMDAGGRAVSGTKAEESTCLLQAGWCIAYILVQRA